MIARTSIVLAVVSTLGNRVLAAEPAPIVASAGDLPTTCASCHRTDGVNTDPATPHLDGQLREYLVESIAVLMNQKRPTAVTDHLPPALSRDQVNTLADRYASVKTERQRETTDADKIVRGRMIYLERCTGCHEDNGRSTDSKGIGTPFLAGQRIGYLRGQMREFLAGKRKHSTNLMDRAFSGHAVAVAGMPVGPSSGRLQDEDTEALAHFFAATGPRIQKWRAGIAELRKVPLAAPVRSSGSKKYRLHPARRTSWSSAVFYFSSLLR